jgi:hypothetical protein
VAAEKHLSAIVTEYEGLEAQLSYSAGDYLGADDAAEYQRLAVEAKALLDSELGSLNDFSSGLLLAANGVIGPLGTPKNSVVRMKKIVEGAINHIRRRPGLAESQIPANVATFVSSSRLAELRTLPNLKWDYSRLIRLCEELNVAHANGCLMASAMLVRGITDHVPPIFGSKKFSEVANNYAGAQSFRGSMKHLDGSLRNIADAHLHVHIRKAEVLPTQAQLSFQADLDVLLSEIVRLGK